jgi:hypothetical protein
VCIVASVSQSLSALLEFSELRKASPGKAVEPNGFDRLNIFLGRGIKAKIKPVSLTDRGSL